MPKHVIDRARALPSAILSRFARIDRRTHPHASIKALVARPRDRANTRMSAFPRISRGIST